MFRKKSSITCSVEGVFGAHLNFLSETRNVGNFRNAKTEDELKKLIFSHFGLTKKILRRIMRFVETAMASAT